MNKSKGFTLIELLAVVVILAILITLAITAVIPQINKSRKNAFVTDANTVLKAASNKFAAERKTGMIKDDLYASSMPGKVCYSVKSHLVGKYINNNDKDLEGSVEICYGSDCTYESKIWLSNGKYYVNGLEVVKSEKDVLNEITDDSYLKCGLKDEVEIAKDYTDFPFTQTIQTYTIPKTGTYALEVWGAQGGSKSSLIGGYGGYSYGEIDLTEGTILYIGVGGEGKSQYSDNGFGYNGGGDPYISGTTYRGMGGGGATHIALAAGLLSEVTDLSKVLIVAAGGGGVYWYNSNNASAGLSGGGWTDSALTVAKISTSNARYGKGKTYTGGAGTGAGIYGGNTKDGRQGGVGWIANSNLKNGVMYCVGCTEVTDAQTLTRPTTNIHVKPRSNYAKAGNGHARIRYIEG